MSDPKNYVLDDSEKETVVAHLDHGLLEIVHAERTAGGTILAIIRPEKSMQPEAERLL